MYICMHVLFCNVSLHFQNVEIGGLQNHWGNESCCGYLGQSSRPLMECKAIM